MKVRFLINIRQLVSHPDCDTAEFETVKYESDSSSLFEPADARLLSNKSRLMISMEVLEVRFYDDLSIPMKLIKTIPANQLEPTPTPTKEPVERIHTKTRSTGVINK